MLNLAQLSNPVLRRDYRIRDPFVWKRDGHYELFYSRWDGGNSREDWSIESLRTPDFRDWDSPRSITGGGYASPGDIVRWYDRFLLPFQTYPFGIDQSPPALVVCDSTDGEHWSLPHPLYPLANAVKWNTKQRAIDPAFIVVEDVLHLFFVGSMHVQAGPQSLSHANLLGHAITRDPTLEHWELLTPEAPVLGLDRAPDGVENITIFQNNGEHTMIFSEGLANQHLAMAQSSNLTHWHHFQTLEIERQNWMHVKYGAPYVWAEHFYTPSGEAVDGFLMLLMGEDRQHHTSFGLLFSRNGKTWKHI